MTETEATRLAILEHEIKDLKHRLASHELKTENKLTEISTQLTLIHKDINQVKGGWYGLFALLTLVGGIGAIVGRFVFRN